MMQNGFLLFWKLTTAITVIIMLTISFGIALSAIFHSHHWSHIKWIITFGIGVLEAVTVRVVCFCQ